MKRAVICVANHQDYVNDLKDFSIMIINPNATDSRRKYLLDKSDYSVLITDQGISYRTGGDYANERLFWYTSGTTGDSKFCSFSQQQLANLAKRICTTYNITDNDRYTSIMPLWHAHGQGMYWATQYAGCETHFVGVKKLKHISDYAPTFITAIPDFLKVISEFNFNHLRFIRSCSAALPDQLYQKLQEKYQIPVIEAFGMTEALSHCFTNPLYGERRIGTIGLPDGVEADIVNGELHIRGVSVCTSDWYNTGDFADTDEQGYYRILGRVNDRINIKGYKIDPISIERQLQEKIPNIEDCVVFGEQKLNCLYTGNVDVKLVSNTLIEMHQACNPAFIQQVDTIPIPDNGKISRTWLKTKLNCK